MASLDISVAFLKGMSFDEVQKIRGGPKRKVSIQLPHAQAGMPSGVQFLRQFPGFEGFNDAIEVLEMLKGGFGLVWTHQICSLAVPTQYSEQQEYLQP